MGVPVEIIIPPFVPAATTVNVALSVPQRAFIMRFRVVQIGGALNGFNAALYSKQTAADPAATNGALSSDAELYRVNPKLIVASGSASGEQIAGWYYYVNQDGGPTNRKRLLYLHLVITTATTDKTFGVSIAFEEPTNL